MSNLKEPKYTMTIGQLLAALNAIPASYDKAIMRIKITDEYSNIGDFHPYRGLYCTLAVKHHSPHTMTKQQFVKRLQRIVNKQLMFSDYSSGHHSYGTNSLIWTSRNNECRYGYAITGVDTICENRELSVVLRTGYINAKQIYMAAPRISVEEIVKVEAALNELLKPVVSHPTEPVIMIPCRHKAFLETCLTAIPRLIDEIDRLKG